MQIDKVEACRIKHVRIDESRSLNENLRALGYRTEPTATRKVGAKRVLRTDGSLLIDGDSAEVWRALRAATAKAEGRQP